MYGFALQVLRAALETLGSRLSGYVLASDREKHAKLAILAGEYESFLCRNPFVATNYPPSIPEYVIASLWPQPPNET